MKLSILACGAIGALTALTTGSGAAMTGSGSRVQRRGDPSFCGGDISSIGLTSIGMDLACESGGGGFSSAKSAGFIARDTDTCALAPQSRRHRSGNSLAAFAALSSPVALTAGTP